MSRSAARFHYRIVARRGVGRCAAAGSTIVDVTVLVCALMRAVPGLRGRRAERYGRARLGALARAGARPVLLPDLLAADNLRSIEGKLDAEFW